MGSLARKIKRKQARLAFDEFTRAFANEKRYQENLLSDGQPLPEGHRRLGRKPPFGVWKKSVEIAQERIKQEAEEKRRAQEAEDKKDLEWKDK